MPRTFATRRASSTADSEQQPPCFADSSVSPRGHCWSVIPTTSWPWACSNAAATEESTPPDIATAILMRANLSNGLSARCLADEIEQRGRFPPGEQPTKRHKPKTKCEKRECVGQVADLTGAGEVRADDHDVEQEHGADPERHEG